MNALLSPVLVNHLEETGAPTSSKCFGKIGDRFASPKGVVLILTLWVLSLLTIFAVHIGMQVRQRATLMTRLQIRSQLRYLAEAGVKKGDRSVKTRCPTSQWSLHALR